MRHLSANGVCKLCDFRIFQLKKNAESGMSVDADIRVWLLFPTFPQLDSIADDAV